VTAKDAKDCSDGMTVEVEGNFEIFVFDELSSALF